MATELKNIRIKTGVIAQGVSEAEDQQRKVDQMRQADPTDYNIKKQVEILDEAKAMIADSQQRFETAFSEFKALLSVHASVHAQLADTDEFRQAQKVLNDVQASS
ncbi:tubulin binding cofactor A [Capsaspora owczarzaki ATCC 30864]|uniref:Tubulin-specific chaperone A n=1 Tax=Capsaspora owczarzaki (strain ATCC 30864) TaxID=595528 RepID=A0A0D2VM64_CAPO3|nr:tubulin binding cofactor A [Capsaspora owczarzaki ATCC 30864]KJE91217.1 tubulin binding cofactor A [Capsaspora owczarzaki ATCC 30864]|eukprot:XP_004349131.2 tubulin binding cofactor A [Capsaspora owczarzaki ATCC 30864]